MGELSLIEKFRAQAPTHPWITIGPGHDCAALKWPASQELLFKIDQVIEGTHFVFDGFCKSTPYQAGWKAMAKACSDIAAAGGWPVAAAVAINIRKGSNEAIALEVYEGLIACCKRFQFGLAGGDFSTSESGLSVCVSLLGKCERHKDGRGRAWQRGGARRGDVLIVTGPLGGSRLGKHHEFMPRLEEARKIRELCPDGVHACIDITDGLSRDLHHICKESQCGARIFSEQIPITHIVKFKANDEESALHQALTDGEDFELLLAIDKDEVETLKRDSKYYFTQIGRIELPRRGVVIVAPDGTERPLPDVGYEHHV
ncbi:MAG TPA: thiamine-phosphate kinase [Planctomycetota bacterium]|nr:thiamine-phosphate kinase [Planctomycetota bacterium]